jgi:hypothetical protein
MFLTSLALASALSASPPTGAAGAHGALEHPSSAWSVGPTAPNPIGLRFRYHFLELEYATGDLTGPRAFYSTPVDGPLLVVARASYLDEDVSGPVDVDILALSAGVGYVHTVEEGLDLVGTAELELGNRDIDGPGASSSNSTNLGLRGRGGVRYGLTEVAELFGGLNFRTIYDNNFFVDLGVRFEINREWSTHIQAELGDDNLIAFGLRYSF